MPRRRKDVPWLDTRDNGNWYAFWYDPDRGRTERESLGTRDAGEAAKRFGKFLIEGPKAARARGDAGLSVRQALSDYWREHCKEVDDRGRDLVADPVRQENAIRHLVAYFGDTALKTLGPLESRAYRDARRQGLIGGGVRRISKTGSDSTIRRELHVLVAAANHAVKWKRLTAADLPRVEYPKEDRGGEPVEYLTEEQLRGALARAEVMAHDEDAEPRQRMLHAFILVTYYTAARKRSIETLTKAQVDLKHGTINLMTPGARTTKKRKPIVPIYPEIRPTIERLMEGEGQLLFGGHDFYRPFVKLLARMGIEGHPHLLRHSRATHLLQAGADIYMVARLLGDTLATVDRVYGHCSPEFLAMKAQA